jgi:hypothetical protein
MCVIHLGELNNQNKTGVNLTDTTQGGTANNIDINGILNGSQRQRQRRPKIPSSARMLIPKPEN